MSELLSISFLLPILKPFLPYLIITALVWITYHYTLKCGFVIDDIEGMGGYDGLLQTHQSEPIKNNEKLAQEEKTKQIAELNKRHLIIRLLNSEYGMIYRWVRYHLMGGNFPSKINYPDGPNGEKGKPIPSGKIPWRHHLFSIIVFNVTMVATYFALSQIIGGKLALFAVLLLIVHPCTTQGVAWISGIAYPLSLLYMDLTLLLLHWFYNGHISLNNGMWVVPVFCVLQFLAIHAIFAVTAMLWVLMFFLGYNHFGFLSILVSGVMTFDIIRQTVSLRVGEFNKQNMGQSTIFGPRKFIVAMKTLWYYLCLVVAPIRMGLYHEWGFHYEKSIERVDKMFWAGLFAFLFLIAAFFFTTSFVIKLGILWFIIFSTGFWNWITAQQFVTERYVLVANLGFCIILGFLTQNYLWLYTLILGIYLCRSWCHLPTYDNEMTFYQSNAWNFKKSEIAYGNLGVVYAKAGLSNSAMDLWRISAELNPDYDVPWVNIFYAHRTSGQQAFQNGNYDMGIAEFKTAIKFLEKALNAKVCHFPDEWKKEYTEIYNNLKNFDKMFTDELRRLFGLTYHLKGLFLKATTTERVKEINESVLNNDKQIKHLLSFMSKNNLHVIDTELMKALNTDKIMSTIGGKHV